ncbi:hypothetical protein ABLI39_13955 [Pseudarthrobacter sp. B907]|uniref:hypothetical protein n=1 Tax=Pseudarthrobacter sp. B907 TaxID=3158261 RepID=UPI0032DB256D
MSDLDFGFPPEYDRSIPLKAVRVSPPSPTVIHSQSEYTVFIELNRSASRFEQAVVRKFFPQGRIVDNTLELGQVTIERIAENPSSISDGLQRVEREGRIAEDAALEEKRQRDEEAAAEAARYENLKHVAEQVRFP